MSFKDVVENLVSDGKKDFASLIKSDKDEVIAAYIESMTDEQRWEVISEGDKTNKLTTLLPLLFSVQSTRLDVGNELAHIAEQYLKDKIAIEFDEVAQRYLTQKFPSSFARDEHFSHQVWSKCA